MASEEKYVGQGNVIFTVLYLILLNLWFHKIFKLIFRKSSSWPKIMYVEHSRKLACATFLGTFPILLVQQFCGTFMESCLLEYAIVLDLTGCFGFLFWFSSAILVSKIKSLFLNHCTYQSSVSHVTTSTTYYHGKCVLIYKLKDFR